jgi:hypothetical protein
MVYVVMTLPAQHERLAPSRDHDAFPLKLWSSTTVQVGKFANVVHFALGRAATEFALVCQQSLDEFSS